MSQKKKQEVFFSEKRLNVRQKNYKQHTSEEKRASLHILQWFECRKYHIKAN
jgi:hypothetical protein